MNIPKGKKVYFASDNHLGAPNHQKSRVREKQFVVWLDTIKADAAAIYLMGDLFDLWIEYKRVVPKGFVRVLGKLAELADSGIPIYFFVGNHDMWMQDYFETELGIPVYYEPQQITLNNTSFFIGHGDGLGPGDKGYKRMKKVFRNPFIQWLYRLVHPDLGLRIAQHMSLKNRLISGDDDKIYNGPDSEWLVHYCKEKLKTQSTDYFIFGHRHLPLNIELSKTSRYINLGDWLEYNTYAVFDGNSVTLSTWETS
ncbi:MAG: UDP-2,3-diacylglucosamine diphosphatase [Bacteroidetes bacterium]|nr:UDP-2,3-diacylglucosamine diphosphatase [Bacteroidota bacterium]MDA0888480.1 UDP-2,3-diacylglucosamine diphosphatase [Bacteroidota bacterium]MDA1084123.1 UDP-2,3-diacylglucosamine diphosphatase [Bacteroidota bacterium]